MSSVTLLCPVCETTFENDEKYVVHLATAHLFSQVAGRSVEEHAGERRVEAQHLVMADPGSDDSARAQAGWDDVGGDYLGGGYAGAQHAGGPKVDGTVPGGADADWDFAGGDYLGGGDASGSGVGGEHLGGEHLHGAVAPSALPEQPVVVQVVDDGPAAPVPAAAATEPNSLLAEPSLLPGPAAERPAPVRIDPNRIYDPSQHDSTPLQVIATVLVLVLLVGVAFLLRSA